MNLRKICKSFLGCYGHKLDDVEDFNRRDFIYSFHCLKCGTKFDLVKNGDYVNIIIAVDYNPYFIYDICKKKWRIVGPVNCSDFGIVDILE